MSNYSGSQLPRSFIHILYVAPHDGLGTRRHKHMPHAAAWFRREDYQSVRQIMDDSDKKGEIRSWLLQTVVIVVLA